MHDGPWSWRPGVTPLVVACDRGQFDVAHLLLNVGADPNPPRNACVRVVSSPTITMWLALILHGNISLHCGLRLLESSMLWSNGCWKQERMLTKIIWWALHSTTRPLVNYLITQHHPRQTLLMDACGHVALIPLVHQFLEFGAIVDKIDRKAWVCLHDWFLISCVSGVDCTHARM